jgi:hypothetical protein
VGGGGQACRIFMIFVVRGYWCDRDSPATLAAKVKAKQDAERRKRLGKLYFDIAIYVSCV